MPRVFVPSKLSPVLKIPPVFIKDEAGAGPRKCRVDPYETLAEEDEDGKNDVPELAAAAWEMSTISPGGLGTLGTWTRRASLWSARDKAEGSTPRRRLGDPIGAKRFADSKMDCLTSSVGTGGGGASGGRLIFPNAEPPVAAG